MSPLRAAGNVLPEKFNRLNDTFAGKSSPLSPKRIVRMANSGSETSLAIPVQLESIDRIFAVIDTAAQITVISSELYEELQMPNALAEKIQLTNAEKGSSMEGFILRSLNMRIGSTSYKLDVVVAPISDKMLLGLDFLQKYEAKLDLVKKEITLGNQVQAVHLIKLPSDSPSLICRVTLAKRTVVPPNSKLFAGVKLDPLCTKDMVIEPNHGNNGLLMGAGIVQGTTALVSFINDSDHHISLPSGHACGIAVELDTVLSDTTDDHIEGSIRSVQEAMDVTDEDLHAAIKQLPEHIQPLYSGITSNLSNNQRMQLIKVLIKHTDVFARHDFDLGNFQPLKHCITLTDEKPFKDRMRRTPLCFQDEEEKTLQHMLDAGVIRPSTSEWASAPVLIRKKDGSVRYCIDYRNLNSKTVKDAFPLPRIEDCLDALSGSSFFSSLDMASGYWQIPMSDEDAAKTAFVTRFGLFEHVRMPFGLCNAPATFSRAMGLVLRNLAYKEVLAYLDDVVVIGRDFQDHLRNLDTVLSRFGNFTLKLKPRKCHLFQTSIDFLGHKVSPNGISVQDGKMKAITEWPIPKSRDDVMSFLGTVNYHRKFIKDYAQLSRPLYDLYHSKQKFEWNDAHQNAFDALKTCMTNPPILAFPNDKYLFVLDCDASNVAIGAELLQCHPEGEKVIAYASYSLTPAQRKYCTTRKELLALVTFVRSFRHYLLGRRFVVRTDHASLTWIMRFRHLEGQLARWMEELSQYDMEILHRSGALHSNADGLSRIPDSVQFCNCYEAGKEVESLPCGGCRYCRRCHSQWSKFEQDVDDVVPIAVREIQINYQPGDLKPDFEAYTSLELREMQMKDGDLIPIFRWLEEGPSPNQSELFRTGASTKYLWNCNSQLEIHSGVLYYRWENPALKTSKLKLVVPEKLKKEVIMSLHDTRVGGHFGRDKTIARVKDSFIWYGLHEDIRAYVESCTICLSNKKSNRAKRSSLEDYQAGIPLERVHIDILGPFVESHSGNRYVLMIVDQFTKWVCCLPIRDQSAETIAEVFYNNFITIFGCPLQIHTDQGRNFESNYFKALCEMLQIIKTRTTPYRPSSNGQVERFNRVVLQYVRCFLEGKQADWDLHLPSLGMSIRSMENRSTGFTANFLMFGREVTLPTDIVYDLQSVNSTKCTPPEYIQKKLEVLRNAFASVRKNLLCTHKRNKRLYDTKLNHMPLQVGDIVYKLDNAGKVGQSKKLSPICIGPFLVMKVISPALYMIADRKRETVVHHDKLLLSKNPALPYWLKRKRHQLLGTPDANDVDYDSSLDAGSEAQDHIADVTVTRSGRPTRLPAKYKDYVLD